MSETETATEEEDAGTPMQIAGAIVGTADGGDLELSPNQPMDVPDGLQFTATGALFGPLEISAYPDSTARIGALDFVQEESFADSLFGSGAGEGLFGSLIAFGSASRASEDQEPGDTHATRRDVLRAIGLGVTAGAATATARGATQDTLAHKATFEAIENPAGLRVRVFDRVPGYLPTDTTYFTFVNGQEYARFSAASDEGYGDVVPQRTGSVTVGPEGAAGGFLAGLRTDKTVVYNGLTLSKSTADAQAGEQLVFSDNDILVEAAAGAGADRTMLAINGQSIPHRTEDREDEVGYYGVSDDRLVYTVGNQPPSAGSVTFTLFANRSDELVDDATRVVQ